MTPVLGPSLRLLRPLPTAATAKGLEKGKNMLVENIGHQHPLDSKAIHVTTGNTDSTFDRSAIRK